MACSVDGLVLGSLAPDCPLPQEVDNLIAVWSQLPEEQQTETQNNLLEILQRSLTLCPALHSLSTLQAPQAPLPCHSTLCLCRATGLGALLHNRRLCCATAMCALHPCRASPSL